MWADELPEIAQRVERAIGWPESMPFLGVVTQGSMLSLGTATLSKERPAPKAFVLGPRELEEAGAEGYRLQEQLDVGNKYYTKYWQEHGRTNGTVVACRRMHEVTTKDVGCLLLFADPASEASFTTRALGLLDAAYPRPVGVAIRGLRLSCQGSEARSHVPGPLPRWSLRPAPQRCARAPAPQRG